MTPEDRRFLGLAFDLARRGLGSTSPNPAVGALVVSEGRVVGSGYHARAGDEHAETIALRSAGAAARGADLFLNLEPCCHHRILDGRAAPCVEQIVAAGVRRVVAAARDPNPRMDGKGFARLREAGVIVEPEDPVFARMAARFNEVFFVSITTGRPFIVLKTGMTLDGRIALASGASQWITDPAAREEGRALRRLYDAVLIGVGTVLADDPLLLADPPEAGAIPPATSASPGAAPSRRVRVVLDSHLRTPPGSRLASTADRGSVLVYASERASETAQHALEAKGVTVIRAPGERPALSFVLSDLAARGATSLLVEGGSTVLGSFLDEGLAHKVCAFVAPSLMGGTDSKPAFGGRGAGSLGAMMQLTDLHLRRRGSATLVVGYPGPRVRPDPGGAA